MTSEKKHSEITNGISAVPANRELLGDDPATNAEYQIFSLADLAEIEQDLQRRLRARA